jgi:hypothetical protein
MLNEKYGHKSINPQTSNPIDSNKNNPLNSKPPGTFNNKIQTTQSDTMSNQKSIANPPSENNNTPNPTSKKPFQPIASVFAAATAAVIKQNNPAPPSQATQPSYPPKENNTNVKEVNKYPNNSNLPNEMGPDRANFSKNQPMDSPFLNPTSMQAFQSQLPFNFAEMMNSPSFMASMTSMFNALTQNGNFPNKANFNFANMQGMMQKFCNDWNKNTNMNSQQQFSNKNKNRNFNQNADYDSNNFPMNMNAKNLNNSNLLQNFNNFANSNNPNNNSMFFKEFSTYLNGFAQNMNRPPAMSNDEMKSNEANSGGFYSNNNYLNKPNNNNNTKNNSPYYGNKNNNFGNNNNGNNNYNNNNSSYNFKANEANPSMPPNSSQYFNYKNTNTNMNMNLNMNNSNNMNKRKRF